MGGKTPLEAANVPYLDALAREGVQGLLTVIDDKVCPETDSGIMALLGYDPLRYYTGRGALEALGAGYMSPGENAVGFRINFASYDRDRQKLDRRTARDLSLEEQQQLVSELRQEISLKDFPGVEYSIAGFGRHRGILCFKSQARELSANVSNTDPGFLKMGPFGVPNPQMSQEPEECRPLDDTEAASYTAQLVNHYVRESSRIMDRSEVNRSRRAKGSLPANLLLFRDAGGQFLPMQAFQEKYGWTLSFYGQIPAEHGLCKLIGGNWNDARMPSGQTEKEYYGRMVNALRQDPADLVVVHIKAADEPGHDGLPQEKMQAIERFDRDFMGPLLDRHQEDDLYLVTGDHATPCELKLHSADRVPALVSSRKFRADSTASFCEREAAAGGLPVHRAAELLSYVNQVLSAK